MTSFPFDPQRLAALGRLARSINAESAPPPISEPVVITEDGRVRLPVPDAAELEAADVMIVGNLFERKYVSAELHAGMTLQWAPLAPVDGLLVEFRGGAPDGDECRDAVAVCLSREGLRRLICDLQAIESAL